MGLVGVALVAVVAAPALSAVAGLRQSLSAVVGMVPGSSASAIVALIELLSGGAVDGFAVLPQRVEGQSGMCGKCMRHSGLCW